MPLCQVPAHRLPAGRTTDGLGPQKDAANLPAGPEASILCIPILGSLDSRDGSQPCLGAVVIVGKSISKRTEEIARLLATVAAEDLRMLANAQPTARD